MYFGAFAIVAGILLVFFGRKFIKPAVFIAGFLTSLLLFSFIFYAVYFDKVSQASDFWWFLGAGVLVGIGVGLLLSCFIKVGAAILAGWGGFCLGMILNESIVFRAGQEWLFWTTIVICVVVSAVLAFYVFDLMTILATVALGSYAMVRGVAAYAGHYYNEVYMA